MNLELPNFDTELTVDLPKLLTETQDALGSDECDVQWTITRLSRQLEAIRLTQAPEDWERSIAVCQAHPLCGILHQDPLTERSFRQPRGYAGDAELLDIIYAETWKSVYDRNVSTLGEKLFDYTIHCRAPAAVRYRKVALAEIIDGVCAETKQASILSVACGHLRELAITESIQRNLHGRFIGLDQDLLSLSVVRQQYRQHNVTPLEGTLKDLFQSDLSKEKFDLVYAAGIYDYLDERMSKKLTNQMFSMLNPNGRLVIFNYAPALPDIGYMDAFMNWRLRYRDLKQMRTFSGLIDESLIAAEEIKLVSNESLCQMELRRAG